MTMNSDPKRELQTFRQLLVARRDEEREQARRFRSLARERDERVDALNVSIVEADAAIDAINARRGESP